MLDLDEAFGTHIGLGIQVGARLPVQLSGILGQGGVAQSRIAATVAPPEEATRSHGRPRLSCIRRLEALVWLSKLLMRPKLL